MRGGRIVFCVRFPVMRSFEKGKRGGRYAEPLTMLRVTPPPCFGKDVCLYPLKDALYRGQHAFFLD